MTPRLPVAPPGWNAVALALLAFGAGRAQTIVPADQVAEFFLPEKHGALECQVKPLAAALDFSLRFQSGYTVRVPLTQHREDGRRWLIAIKIKPEPDRPPVYLLDKLALPDIQNGNRQAEAAGGFSLGEGDYRVTFALVDDQARACRAEWSVQAKRNGSSRDVNLSIQPGIVEALSASDPQPASTEMPTRRIDRLTVLLHAAPLSPAATKIPPGDLLTLLDMLSALTNSVHANSVRLIVFSIDRQSEIYRREDFTGEQLAEVHQKLFDLQFATVTYRQLQNTSGPSDFLKSIVIGELESKTRSEAVVFLGPRSRPVGKLDLKPELRASQLPKFLYLEYLSPPDATRLFATAGDQPPGANARLVGLPALRTGNDTGSVNRGYGRADPDKMQITDDSSKNNLTRDGISDVVSRLHGRTYLIARPADFAKALTKLAAR